MKAKSTKYLLFVALLGFFYNGMAGDTKTPHDESAANNTLIGDAVAGEARYKQTCVNCHGAAGKGVASFPKISGQEIAYTTSKLETYREGTKIGPNSSLMIMMAKPLTDEEIANLAAYLKEATP